MGLFFGLEIGLINVMGAPQLGKQLSLCFVLHLNLSRLAGWVDGRINWNYNHLSSLVESGLRAELGNSWMLFVVSETRRFWGNIKTFAPLIKILVTPLVLGIYSFFDEK